MAGSFGLFIIYAIMDVNSVIFYVFSSPLFEVKKEREQRKDYPHNPRFLLDSIGSGGPMRQSVILWSSRNRSTGLVHH